jgi:DNA-binding transcriptional MerR regulator
MASDSANDATGGWLSPAEMAEACDVTVDTLRYYEREHLLASVSRSRGGQRRYQTDDVAWVKVLRCLRVTALPIREMRRFAQLVRAGDAGVGERLNLLREHRAEVERQLIAMQDALTTIDHKIEWYAQELDRIPHVDTHGVSTTPTLGGRGIRAS